MTAKEPDNAKPLFSIRIPQTQEVYGFSNTDELVRFLNEEVAFFDKTMRGNTPYAIASREFVKTKRNEIAKLIESFDRAQQSHSNTSEIAERLQAQLRTTFENSPRLVVSGSLERHALEWCRERLEPEDLGSILAIQMGFADKVSASHPRSVAVLAYLITCSSMPQTAAVEKSIGQWNLLIADARKERDESIQRARATLEQIKDDYEATKKKMQEILCLKGPTEYWEHKSQNHWFMHLLHIQFALIIAIWGGVGLIYYANGRANTIAVASIGELWKVIPQWFPVILSTVLLIWSIRIAIRIALSHLHLKTDADERVKLTQTYLALRENSALKDPEALKLILAQLFRNSAVGLVKDDAAPTLSMQPSQLLMPTGTPGKTG